MPSAKTSSASPCARRSSATLIDWRAARYLECPGAWILPVGLTGTEAMFPIGEDALHDVGIVARAGKPIEVDTLRRQAGGDRRAMMDAVGHAIADVLPPEYRGVYGAASRQA